MRKLFRIRKLLGLLLVAVCTSVPAVAQDEEEARDALESIIAAFQQCGPPQAYAILSPYLWNIVAMQTGGAGCYTAIMGAGPVTDTEVIERQDFPVGPLYLIRVQHPSTVADWFIGFNSNSGKIEYLTFQSADLNRTPNIDEGPTEAGGGSDEAPRRPRPDSDDVRLQAACRKYPEMCP